MTSPLRRTGLALLALASLLREEGDLSGDGIPFDEHLGIHPQDSHFLEREMWDLDHTPLDSRPLLLHYHPLVIYRFQVLKQADVVLALFLQGDSFTPEEKRADFEYYDPLTTGDSTLLAVVQSILAAEVGREQDLLWLGERVAVEPLIPAIIDGLGPIDRRWVVAEVFSKVAWFLSDVDDGRVSSWHKPKMISLQVLAGLAVRRELKGRLSGRRPRRKDLTDPVVDIHQLDAKIAELKQQLQPSLAYLQSILA